MYVLKCTFVNNYNNQLAISTKIQKISYKSLQGNCSSVLRPISMT